MDLSFTALEPGIKAQLAEAKLTKSIVKIRHIATTNLTIGPP
jgi:hypothetical protein